MIMSFFLLMMLKKTLVIVNGKANYAVKDLDSGNHMIMVK